VRPSDGVVSVTQSDQSDTERQDALRTYDPSGGSVHQPYQQSLSSFGFASAPQKSAADKFIPVRSAASQCRRAEFELTPHPNRSAFVPSHLPTRHYVHGQACKLAHFGIICFRLCDVAGWAPPQGDSSKSAPSAAGQGLQNQQGLSLGNSYTAGIQMMPASSNNMGVAAQPLNGPTCNPWTHNSTLNGCVTPQVCPQHPSCSISALTYVL
jgi:hypothetical protein